MKHQEKLKKDQNAVAGSRSCTNLPIRQRKTAAEERRFERLQAARIDWNQKRSFIKHRSSEARRKPSEAVRKQKAKLCAARINAQVLVV